MDKTVLDFPEIDTVKTDDILYSIRGTGAGRDRYNEAHHVTPGSILIADQTEFEKYFGTGTETGSGTTVGGWVYNVAAGVITVTAPADTTVVVKPCLDGGVVGAANVFNGVRAFVLKTRIQLSRGFNIIGFNNERTVIVRHQTSTFKSQIKFFSTYKTTQTVTGVATNIFTVADSSLFSPGDRIIHSNDVEFYTVIDLPLATEVQVERPISGAGSGTIRNLVTQVNMWGWSFDGRCDVQNLGGDSNIGEDENGGAFEVPYLGDSVLDCRIINSAVFYTAAGGRGGAIYADPSTTINIRAMNIYQCSALGATTGQGGAVYGVYELESQAYFCLARQGGGFFSCTSGILKAVYCEATTDGGGAMSCVNCNINVIRCKAGTGGSGNGGGVHSGTGNIVLAIECDAFTNGGGGYGMNTSTLRAIDCTASGAGEIAHTCSAMELVWGNAGNIVTCTLGGVRLASNTDATVSGNVVDTNGQYAS